MTTKIRRIEIGTSNRVGLYITPQTRDRLNFLKMHLTDTLDPDRPLNVDETLTFLLDKEGVPLDGRAALSAKRQAKRQRELA